MITLLFEGDPPCIQCILDCGSFVWKAYDSFWPNSRDNWPLLSASLIKCRDVSRWLEFLVPSEKMQTRKTRKRMKLAKLVEHFVILFLANPSPSIFFAVTTVWFIRTALGYFSVVTWENSVCCNNLSLEIADKFSSNGSKTCKPIGKWQEEKVKSLILWALQ